ncbi:MAG TPA: hypothetical protein VM115_06770 [Vicinamibacterales bacterium]|nr:hypothetical protein [Vicinamibacterales bacterium]
MTRRARRRDECTLAGSLLNVDFDVYSTEPLDALADALVRTVDVHDVGREGRRFSLHCGRVLFPFPPLDAAIRV